MRLAEYVLIGIVIFILAVSLYLGPQLPDQIASHWNIQGEVDDYSSKYFGMFLMPGLLFLFALLFIAIPKIDPLKANISKFRGYYDGFIVILFVFLAAVHMHLMLWNIGIQTLPNIFFPIGLGVLMFYIGILCKHAKRNWFIGIRTPWTLSNAEVWRKTHKQGSVLFKITGIIILLGIFFPHYGFYLVIIPIIAVTLYLITYSYFVYQKLK